MPRLIGSRTDPIQKVSRTAEAALSSLIGAPTPITEAQPLTSAERLAAILQRARQITHPAINPLQRDFHKFLLNCWTKDEARAGVVKQFPDYPLFNELCDRLILRKRQLIVKSRRVLASWLLCCFDVWIAAGGQDPRWPELMLSTGNRQVILASKKARDIQGSCWFLRNRVRFIVEELERRGIREKWPEFPTWEWVETEGRASNGSLISAIASGSGQARGAGATLIHAEEIAFWDECESTIQAMIPVTHGGGHLVLITTPQSRSYAHKIYAGLLQNPEAIYQPEPMYMLEGDLEDEDEDDY